MYSPSRKRLVYREAAMFRYALVMLTACSYHPAALGDDMQPMPDGSPVGTDSPLIDGPPACVPFSTQHAIDTCVVPPVGGFELPPGTFGYDTDTGVLTPATVTAPNSVLQGGSRIISVTSFAIDSGAVLRVTGTVPLVVLSDSTLLVAGILDVSSKRSGDAQIAGPGARVTNASSGNGTQDAGGGGGAGFGDQGGDGGNGGANNGGNGGNSSIADAVFGGRSGADGGSGANRGHGGAGGGAVELVARTSITISGAIDAGGAGGQGGTGDQGGGGGGSGGYIGLDSLQITLMSSAELGANGGGGGTGCDSGNGPEGANGGLTTTPANGGANTGCSVATAGGTGGARNNTPGVQGSDSTQSGGGGGGGIGFLLNHGTVTDQGALTSPAIQSF